MDLFTRRYHGLLSPAPAWPSLCTKLSLLYANDSLAGWGPQLLRFSRLRELYVGWYSGSRATIDSLFPPELAQLSTLRRVTLLNLPLAAFPTWVIDLPNLQYLTVRGTDLTRIPEWIYHLKHLRTLRVENCALTTLPNALRQMTHLRELGLSDTQLRDFSPAQFPPYLKRLSFDGSGYYVRRDVATLQQALPGTEIWPNLSHFDPIS
jgi:hypothetical protein